LFLVLVAITILGLAVFSQRERLGMWILARGLESAMSADVTAELDDGLHVALCGAGGPMTDPHRSGPCVAVVAGKKLFVVDAGTYGLRNLGVMRYPVGRIEALLLTHFHSDHIDGLGELATIRWVQGGNTEPLPVIGPTGVEQVVDGFDAAYAQDAIYRNDHHGDRVAPPTGHGMTPQSFETPGDGELVTVYEAGGVKIQMLEVDHDPVRPAVGYLFAYKGRSALITGDTAKSANVEAFAQGVDLLVHDALAPNLVGLMNRSAQRIGNQNFARITLDILDYHASPVEAAEIARDADVGHLLYYHIVPPLIVPGIEKAWLEGVDEVFDDYTVGQDGTAFSLPAGTDEIIKTSRGL
jgi:ribonuclease Z